MKTKPKVDIYTTQYSKIGAGQEFLVDYFDDTRNTVWLKKEGEKELPAGDTFVSLECFINFFDQLTQKATKKETNITKGTDKEGEGA